MPIGFFKKLYRAYMLPKRFKKYYGAAAPVDLDKISEFRSEAFPIHELTCWLDRPNALQRIEERLLAGEISEVEAQACRQWERDGYFIAPGLIDHATIDATWAAYEEALEDGLFGDPNYADPAQKLHDRKLDPHMKIPKIFDLQSHPDVLKWTDLFFGRKTVPFQTIIGHAGSQQAAHSDSIHMTTYPLGYLSANWIAFEDVDPMSGPLEYYPGSHRLPYIFSADVGIQELEFKEKGYALYSEKYEPVVQQRCEAAGFEKKVFLPKKGDVLFWHANLVHGGGKRLDMNVSRKALVCHFFAEGVVTYHDLSGNPTRLHKNGMFAPLASN